MISKRPPTRAKHRREAELQDAVGEAIYAYARSLLEDEGGSIEVAAKKASDRIVVAYRGLVFPCPEGIKLDDELARRLSADVERLQAAAAKRIQTGERLFAHNGHRPSTFNGVGGGRWHKVATSTRALCGSRINIGTAWVLRPAIDESIGSMCLRCAKL